MKQNLYLELAGLIIAVILWIACIGKYKKIDLKSKIYVHLVRVTTICLMFNVFCYAVLEYELSSFIPIGKAITGASMIFMTWFLTYLNYYLLESIFNQNRISTKTHILIGTPLVCNILAVIAGWNITFYQTENNVVQAIPNLWYMILCLTVFLSIGEYVFFVSFYYKTLKDKHQYVFFAVPVVLLIFYYIRYQVQYLDFTGIVWKDASSDVEHRLYAFSFLAFGYSVILLLIYIYSYSQNIKLDSLTRLPDASAFKKMLDYRIGQSKDMIVAMITINDFKHVNREYGFQNGNLFLKAIAKYLKVEAPKLCLVRYGGDKFAIVFDEWTLNEVEEWCSVILERFEHTWEVGKLQHKLSLCISLIEYSSLASSSDEMLDLLEHMNTYGKLNKRNQYIVCNDDFKNSMQRRLRIAARLNEAVQQRSLDVEYQPILEVKKNAFTRAQAILRLRDEELGDIDSMEFYPIAEETGYLIDIGYILLEQVCQYLKSMKERDELMPVISMSWFRQQIMDELLVQKVSDMLKKYDVQPDCIAFELPESVFVTQYKMVQNQIRELNGLGCRFYLDGFGKALVDFSNLIELPFEVIKISKDMLKEAEQNDSVYLLISAMVAVFEENGKQMLSNGIETEHLKEMADLLFMDFQQGDYLSVALTDALASEAFQKSQVVENAVDIEQLIKETLEQQAMQTE